MLRMAVTLVSISTFIAIGSSMIHDHSILKPIKLHERGRAKMVLAMINDRFEKIT